MMPCPARTWRTNIMRAYCFLTGRRMFLALCCFPLFIKVLFRMCRFNGLDRVQRILLIFRHVFSIPYFYSVLCRHPCGLCRYC
ncbi:MAG: hypothetical protein LBH00_11685, partial [Planctomycetaceae bacterium]|nr:hypothetical protein [Planctomycetaceae bacterium]